MSSLTTTVKRIGRAWYQFERMRITLAADSPELEDRFSTNGKSVVALRVVALTADHEFPAHSAVNGAKGGCAGGDAGGGDGDGDGGDRGG